jgi:hypothetical protein
MRLDPKSALIGALGCALALLAFNGSRAEAQRPTSYGGGGGGGGDANRDLIAVTGSYGSGASVLYLIDTRTRHLSVYKTDNGRKLEFVAARNFEYDLKLDTYNDGSETGFGPDELRRSWIRTRGGASSRPVEGELPATAGPPGGR